MRVITSSYFNVYVSLSNALKVKGQPMVEGNAYLQDKINSDWSKDIYVRLCKMIAAKTGETSELGKSEIKLILGNSDEEVIKNYKLPITREKVANIMGLFVSDGNLTTQNRLSAKDWNNVNEAYKKRINELADRNIFKGFGYEDGTVDVRPQANLTKVEAISLINRLYNAL